MEHTPRYKSFKPVNHASWCADDNLAGVILAEIVNETQDAKTAMFVNKQASRFAAGFKHIGLIKNNSIKRYLGLLFLREAEISIKQREYSPKITDYFIGMVRTIHKEKVIYSK